MEPTLNAAFSDLQTDVANYLGYNPVLVVGSKEASDVDRCVRGGLRKFYHCGYDWSFLKPVASLPFASGASTVLLPDDFGGPEGRVTVKTTGSTSQPWLIDWRNEGEVRQMYSGMPSFTGPPMYVAQEPLNGTTATGSTRSQLLIFPLADQAYTLQMAYYVNPNYLTGALPYAYGGPQHAETILECCLSVAELILDDQAGVHAQEMERMLAVSQDVDRRMKPQKIGKNIDRSDLPMFDKRQVHWWAPAATYNGNPFG